MGRHRIKQRQLAEAARVRPAAVNALYHGERERVDVGQLAAILDGLHALTGQRYTVGDLLEYTPADAAPSSPSEMQTARALLIPPSKPGRARGLTPPAPVKGPPIEALLAEHRGPEL